MNTNKKNLEYLITKFELTAIEKNEELEELAFFVNNSGEKELIIYIDSEKKVNYFYSKKEKV